jgi:hypothetical protein
VEEMAAILMLYPAVLPTVVAAQEGIVVLVDHQYLTPLVLAEPEVVVAQVLETLLRPLGALRAVVLVYLAKVQMELLVR